MKNNIKAINGNEIIDFLNKNSMEGDDLGDTNICANSFVFESQKVASGKYTLYFTVGFNNWGTDQDIRGNELHITKEELWLGMDEPFDGDGTEDTLKDILTPFLETHVFSTNQEEKFYSLLEYSYGRLAEIGFTSKEELQSVIDKLIEAKTYMK